MGLMEVPNPNFNDFADPEVEGYEPEFLHEEKIWK